ncbi:serine/threonine-protein kinase [Amnibacterium kyonggiense]|uniref:non-specific serine/threonine protein kinase n=1 Tax=Amnibacterium kyonggiense TaxID=595671 RepID=A0A4R7FLG8_9MICO|nr:serine/threonine-protein kinase [Amnibacterium kyonggiense]TDS77226.1 serine/threonine protein kinase [Amnibacterium kyonggiense]
MSEPGDRIADRYLLTRRIAAGGMGVVWQAEDEVLRRTVAVKQLRVGAAASEADAALARQRAMREARITARLHHPHAVSIFDVVDHDGAPHIVMQYVPSESLAAVLRRRSALPVEDAARIGAEVASALQAAHALGIVHRDVKPANILIAQPGGEALLTDFGISHAADDAALTSTGMLSGTPAYLAPEVALGGESAPASDVFSLGSTLYAAVEGRPPFGDEANGIAVLHRVAAGSFTAPTRSGALQPVLLRMMRPDPDERPTMAEAAAALSSVATQQAGADAPTAVLVPEGDGDDATQAFGEAPTEQDRAAATLIAPAAAPATATTAVPAADFAQPTAAPTVRFAAPSEEAAPRRRRRALLWLIGAAAVLVIAIAGFGLLRGGASGGPAPAQSTSRLAVAVRSATPSASTPTPTATTPTASAPASASTAPVGTGGQGNGTGKGKGNDKGDKGGKGKGGGKGPKGG